MKKIRLTREERAIEAALLRGDYKIASKAEFNRMAKLIAGHRKDAVLNIRVNSQVLGKIKLKAKSLGVPYQTLISEFLNQLAA